MTEKAPPQDRIIDDNLYWQIMAQLRGIKIKQGNLGYKTSLDVSIERLKELKPCRLSELLPREETIEKIAQRIRPVALNEIEGHGKDCITPWGEIEEDSVVRGHWILVATQLYKALVGEK